jgi:hypothetical protein
MNLSLRENISLRDVGYDGYALRGNQGFGVCFSIMANQSHQLAWALVGSVKGCMSTNAT